jgi:hypothetical protein
VKETDAAARLADDNGGETVVVDRTPIVDEGTVVIDRVPAPDEGTVVIDRSVAPDEGTVVIDRSSPDEGTVVIEGRGARSRRAASRSSSVLGDIPRRGQRRELTPAPGGAEVQRTAVLASGPGAVNSYAPRAIPAPPAEGVIPESGPEATRASAPSMPSVVRASTRRSRIALAAFALACVISVVGLVMMIVLLTAG